VIRALAAPFAALALGGCIVVHEADDAPRAAAGPEQTGANEPGAYLLVPLNALRDEAAARVFHEQALPALSGEHALTNAGNAEVPWYCFAYEDAVAAEYGRRKVRSMPGGEALASYLLIDETCAAG